MGQAQGLIKTNGGGQRKKSHDWSLRSFTADKNDFLSRPFKTC
jgi:hypothetical protein